MGVLGMNHLLSALEKFPGTRVLVIGDLMLDRYTWGDAERVSPEAPVLLLRAETEEARLGGAASAAAMLRGLGAAVTLAGVVGNDASGRVLRVLLQDHDVGDELVLEDDSRRTTTKERFMGRTMSRQAHQILRVDSEQRHSLTPRVESQFVKAIAGAIANCAAVLISDYAKGVCTPHLLQQLIAVANEHGVPVLVDPGRGVNYRHYHGATVLKPNRIEAQEASRLPIHSPADAQKAGHKLRDKLACDAVVVTLDSEGAILCLADGRSETYPAEAHEVCDITGAGDMVAATLALGLGSGMSPEDAVRLANAAAGLEVQYQGVATISRDELVRHLRPQTAKGCGQTVALQDMLCLAQAYRAAGQKIVFTNGCFDLLHVGHVTYLQEAASLGDVLIVAINGDAGVRRLKGPGRPVISQSDRAAMLAALACVDHVLIFDEDTPHALLRAIRPDVLVKGGTTMNVVGREVVEAYGGRVCVAANVPNISTTEIVETIRERTSVMNLCGLAIYKPQ